MTEGPGLYVHVPFCSAKCGYCDFYSLAAPRLMPGWLEAIRREISAYRLEYNCFETLYVGGGTPSHLPEDHLAELFGALGAWPLAGPAEVTLEVNPEDVTPGKIKRVLDLGVNRISLGIQSLDDRALRVLSRRHSVSDAIRAARTIRSAGCRNLGLDLIYGLPGQDLADWLSILERALELAPDHLSCYQLTLEPGTRYQKMADQGCLRLPDEETARAMFLATSSLLEDRGFEHYEVSNFARSREKRSRHNQKYWRHVPYLGLGPSAHSYQKNVRWWNVRSIRGYSRALAAGHRPVAESETLSDDQIRLEAVSYTHLTLPTN